MPAYFITATDTDAGKTFISSRLLYAAASDNKTCLGFKPIASGIESYLSKKINTDVELLKAASNVKLPNAIINPYLFKQAIAPHIAAKINNKVIDLQLIKEQINSIQPPADFMIVEGVGGWEVPLNETEGIADLARLLGYPILVVVKIKTGCINHATLTLNAIRQQGLNVAGWVANQVKEDAISEENICAIEQQTNFTCLARIPDLSAQTFNQQMAFFSKKNQPQKEIQALYQNLL